MKKNSENNLEADLDNLMEHCLKNGNIKTMKRVLDNCKSTYDNYEYYYTKMKEAFKE